MSQKWPEKFDLIVVGAGHAGAEAALAGARLSAKTLLLTINTGKIAALSCNPAVGGLAKGHLVKEIDALGGEMAKNTDAAGIQFRLLNRSKGAAVQSSRAQVDIDLYPGRMAKVCQEQPDLWVHQGEAAGLLVEHGRATGVLTAAGEKIPARCVVLTTGTFLRGVIHLGLETTPAGRLGDPPANRLSGHLLELGFHLSRLKTGTTPRLDKSSIDFAGLEAQPGDAPPPLMSFLAQGGPALPQLPCHVTYTNQQTHDAVRENLDQAPMYAGRITGVGARYCPSLEDKVVRFPQRERHQVFLEPQGIANLLVYPNGIPTSLPLFVQKRIVASLPGCEKARIVHPGYAIEYDMSDPLDLTPWLESKLLPGLFMAGQINGTSGYEEAAAQGLMAGINAARSAAGRPPFVLDRSQAYIGVLIDDLVTRGTKEPYRMFTSRAEYRLSLREDNADLRLTPLGREIGLVDEERWQAFGIKQKALGEAQEILSQVRINPGAAQNQALARMGSATLKRPLTAEELLRRPEMELTDLAGLDERLAGLAGLPEEVARQLVIAARYHGYQEREAQQVAAFKAREKKAIPSDFDYRGLPGLTAEAVEKLSRVRPANLGQAGRISGITPAALTVLSLYMRKREAGPE